MIKTPILYLDEDYGEWCNENSNLSVCTYAVRQIFHVPEDAKRIQFTLHERYEQWRVAIEFDHARKTFVTGQFNLKDLGAYSRRRILPLYDGKLPLALMEEERQFIFRKWEDLSKPIYVECHYWA